MSDDAQNEDYSTQLSHIYLSIFWESLLNRVLKQVSNLYLKYRTFYSESCQTWLSYLIQSLLLVGETSPAFRRYRLGLETAPDTKLRAARDTEEQADTVAETPTKSTRWRWCHSLGQSAHWIIAAGSTTSIQGGTTLSTDLQRDLWEPIVEDIGWTTTFLRRGIKFPFLGQCSSSVPCWEGND